MKNDLSIGVIGLWHLGLIYATSFAKKGFKVTGFDDNPKVLDNLNAGILPIFEPGLEELLERHLNKNLFFSNNLEEIAKKKHLFITLDIPVNDVDELDLDPLNKIFELVLKYASNNSTIIISSQVPIGTCRKLQVEFDQLKKKVDIIYFPENLRLGNAFESFLNPNRIILGGDIKVLEKFLKDLDFIKAPSFLMSLESAEMSKHALNTYLATCISLSSELGDICELTGANMDDVVKSLKSEKRVSPNAPLNPGLGFAGGTLGRDIKTLVLISKGLDYKPTFLESVYKVNKIRIAYLVKRVEQIFKSISGKRIGLLGLTYKPGTDTLRRSMSLELATRLKKSGANLIAFDPKISTSIKGYEFIDIKYNLKDFFQEIDIAILMTEWPEFKEKEFLEYASLMKNKIIFDTKNFLDSENYIRNNFKFYKIGSK